MNGENTLLAVVVTPFALLFGMMSLVIFKRSVEWMDVVCQKPKSSLDAIESNLRPLLKVINDAIKRALGESSLTINMTTVLLTSVVLVLICVLFELGTLNHRLTKKEKSK